ncbi:MAG: NAD-dependent succinate-semialdehyde dehydrogenase [Pseudomonadota bacterium]
MSRQLQTINPATAEVLKTYDLMSDDQVETTITDCHTAFLSWRQTSMQHRADVIARIGDVLTEKKNEFARLMVSEMGKLIEQAEQEIDLCAAICRYTAENGPSVLETETRDHINGARGHVAYSPIGVIYGIQPWNFPAYQVVRYSIANLMAGNGVLLKHAESVTGSGLFLADIYETAGLPKNLFSVLLIDHDQSDTVIAHDLVRGVTMTGSAEAGRIIAEKAGRALKKTVLELGSNDAYVVLEDADMDLALEACVTGRIYNNGETCIAAKRFVVVDAIYDDFVDRFVERMSAISYGDPMGGEAEIGPMAREDLRDTLHKQVTESVNKGARIRCGGELPDSSGFYYPATVLDQVEPGQPAYDDELFGPVAAVIRARDANDAMRVANDSRYGLGGGIFSRNIDRAVELAAERFDTGMVYINGFGVAVPNMPFGGVKQSGYGREHGGFGMKEFVNIKAIHVMAA